MTQYYVERSVNGRTEWLAIIPRGEYWQGSFAVIGEIPPEHQAAGA
jgi:hypothetical protein